MTTKATTALNQKLFADLQSTDEVIGNDYAADGVTVVGTVRVPIGDLLRRAADFGRIRILDINTTIADFTTAPEYTVWIARSGGFGALLNDGVALANAQMVINLTGSTLTIQSNGTPVPDSSTIRIWGSAVVTYTGSTVSCTQTLIPLDSVTGLTAALNGKLTPADVVDDRTSTDADRPLSALQGKLQKDALDAHAGAMNPHEITPASIGAFPSGQLSESGSTLTSTHTAIDASSAVAAFLALTIDGNPVAPIATATEAGSVYKLRGLASRPSQHRAAGIYADGSDEAFTVPSGSAYQWGGRAGGAIVIPLIVLPDWTPASDLVLLQPSASNQGVKLTLTTIGKFRLSVGDGTSYTDYTSTEAIGANLPAWSGMQISLVLDRSGLASIYIDGGLFEAFDISAQSDDDISSGSYTVLDAAEGYALGYFAILNYTLSSAEVGMCYQLPDWITRNPSAINMAYYAGDGTGGFAEINTTLTEQTVGGRANVLRAEASVGFSAKRVRLDGATGIVAGRTYVVEFDYYLPAGQADIIAVSGQSSGANVGNPEVPKSTVTGTWTSVKATITAGYSTYFYLILNSSNPSTPSDVTTVGQYAYFDNIRLYEPGGVLLVDLSVAGATKTDLIGANNATRGTTAEDTI